MLPGLLSGGFLLPDGGGRSRLGPVLYSCGGPALLHRLLRRLVGLGNPVAPARGNPARIAQVAGLRRLQNFSAGQTLAAPAGLGGLLIGFLLSFAHTHS